MPAGRRSAHLGRSFLPHALLGLGPGRAPLTVTYTLDRYQPQTVSVQPMQQTVANPNVDVGSYTVMELDPNPVFAELAPAAPPKRTTKRPPPQAGRQAAARARSARRLLTVPAARASRPRSRHADVTGLTGSASCPGQPGAPRVELPQALCLHASKQDCLHAMTATDVTAPKHDRSVRPDDHVSARVGDRSLRPALLLLHVGRHDVPAQGRSADARRARPALHGVHRQGRAETCA